MNNVRLFVVFPPKKSFVNTLTAVIELFIMNLACYFLTVAGKSGIRGLNSYYYWYY